MIFVLTGVQFSTHQWHNQFWSEFPRGNHWAISLSTKPSTKEQIYWLHWARSVSIETGIYLGTSWSLKHEEASLGWSWGAVEGARACRAVVPDPYWSNNLHTDLTPNRSLFTPKSHRAPPLRRHSKRLERDQEVRWGERNQIRGSERPGVAYLGRAPMLPIAMGPGMAAASRAPRDPPHGQATNGSWLGGPWGGRLPVRPPCCSCATDAAVAPWKTFKTSWIN
jgi:hypothetical protein